MRVRLKWLLTEGKLNTESSGERERVLSSKENRNRKESGGGESRTKRCRGKMK